MIKIKWCISDFGLSRRCEYIGRKHICYKENTESVVVASKETGLEGNADKIKYMVMSREKTTGRSQNIKLDNSSSERVEQFEYMGAAATNKNSSQEEIKRRLSQ